LGATKKLHAVRRNAPARSSHGRAALAVCLLASAAMLPTVAADGEPDAPQPDDPLARVLDHLGNLAEFYRDSALEFTCDETISHFTNRGRQDHRFFYIYVYDDERGLQDYRLTPKDARKFRKRRGADGRSSRKSARVEPVTLDRYGLPSYLLRAYSWIFVFQSSTRERYRYRITGESEFLGRPAVGIEFEPVPPFSPDINDYSGTAWVDAETGQILRIEAMHVNDRDRREAFEKSLRSAVDGDRRVRTTHSFQRIVTEFGILRGGMRFPSEVTIRTSRFEVWSDDGSSGFEEFPIFRIRQTYDNCRFYGVRTETEIERLAPDSGSEE
jgi:hypothetical protein